MTPLELANVLQAAAVALTAIFVINVQSALWLDDFRQRIFALRDEVFDYAADGHISFNDPAYRLLRDQMNTLVRYAHQLTFYRLLLGGLMPKSVVHPRPVFAEEWAKKLAGVPDRSVREKLQNFHERERAPQAWKIVGGSPVLLLLAAVAGIIFGLREGATSFANFRDAVRRKIMVGPIDPSLVENEAFCEV